MAFRQYIVLSLAISGITQAAGLANRDYNPLLLSSLIPSASQVVRAGFSASLSLNTSNTHYVESNATEKIHIDAETSVAQFQLNYLHKAWLVQLEIPYISHNQGLFDHAIHTYHKLLGFPNGSRTDNNHNKQTFSYQRQGVEYLQNVKTQGLGNPVLHLSYALQPTTSLHFSYKFGTKNKVLLSGRNDDYAIWLNHAHPINNRLRIYGAFGVSFLGKLPRLSQWQNRHILFGNLGFSYRFKPNWTALAQLDYHQAVLASKLDYLGESLQISIGARYRLSQDKILEFGFNEDLKVDSAPDIGVYLRFLF